MIGDYEFGKQPQDVDLLRWLSQVAASAHAPFIAAAAPSLFNVDRFSAMTESGNVSKIFRSPDYNLWKSFRESDTSRYVGLCLPRVLMQDVYEGADDEDFCYREEVNSAGQEAYLWGNPAYLLASCLIGAFVDRGWCGSILGVEGGGYLSGVPTHIYHGDTGNWALVGPCEVSLTNDQEEGLARLGFIPVTHYKGTDAVVFLSAPSCRRADPSAEGIDAWNLAQLPLVLVTSRFAHYIKAILDAKRGGVSSRDELQAFLEAWIARYTRRDGEDTPTGRSPYPLRFSRIEVEDDAGRPGRFKVTAELVPDILGATPDTPARVVVL